MHTNPGPEREAAEASENATQRPRRGLTKYRRYWSINSARTIPKSVSGAIREMNEKTRANRKKKSWEIPFNMNNQFEAFNVIIWRFSFPFLKWEKMLQIAIVPRVCNEYATSATWIVFEEESLDRDFWLGTAKKFLVLRDATDPSCPTKCLDSVKPRMTLIQLPSLIVKFALLFTLRINFSLENMPLSNCRPAVDSGNWYHHPIIDSCAIFALANCSNCHGVLLHFLVLQFLLSSVAIRSARVIAFSHAALV